MNIYYYAFLMFIGVAAIKIIAFLLLTIIRTTPTKKRTYESVLKDIDPIEYSKLQMKKNKRNNIKRY